LGRENRASSVDELTLMSLTVIVVIRFGVVCVMTRGCMTPANG
jgi:hypothetical protein